MNILDENFPFDQRQLLSSWRIATYHIGDDIGRAAMQDDEIIPLLHRLRRPTFFTFDIGFYKRQLAHPNYCLVCLVALQSQGAPLVRRLLRHRDFNTQAKRMGTVLRISQSGIILWRLHAESQETYVWRQ